MFIEFDHVKCSANTHFQVASIKIITHEIVKVKKIIVSKLNELI